MSPPLDEMQATRVERHTWIVRDVAQKVARAAGFRLLTIEELESAGNEALVQASLRYDPNHTASFATFAHYRVYGAMIDALRQRTPGRRSHQLSLARVAATHDLLSCAAEDRGALRAAGAQPSLVERVASARDLVRRASIATRLSEPDRFEEVEHQAPNPEQRLLADEPRQRLWAMVAGFDGPDRDLLDAIYVQGLTMQEYASSVGSTASTISRRHARLVDRLAKRAAVMQRSDR